MDIDGFGDAYVRPLQYGDSVRFYENRDRTPRMLAALFRRSVAGFEECTPADVRQMVAGIPALLEYAVVSASGLLQSERESEALQSDDDDLYEGHDVPEPRAMAPEEGSAHEEAVGALDEIEEADMIAQLHERGETMASIYQLLPEEINMLDRGYRRLHAREKRQRKKERRSSTSGETAGPYQQGQEQPPATSPGFR